MTNEGRRGNRRRVILFGSFAAGGFRWSIAAVIAAGIAAGPLARVRA